MRGGIVVATTGAGVAGFRVATFWLNFVMLSVGRHLTGAGGLFRRVAEASLPDGREQPVRFLSRHPTVLQHLEDHRAFFAHSGCLRDHIKAS